MTFKKILTTFIKEFIAYSLIVPLCLGSFPATALHPLDPHIQDHTVRLSLKGAPNHLDPETEQLIFIQQLPKDASPHISLDASLWTLPAEAQYLLMKDGGVILTAHKTSTDGLFIDALFKKAFLHPTEQNTLTWGDLAFKTRGNLTLVQGKATKELGIKAVQLCLGVDIAHPLDFRKGFFSKSSSLINHTNVSAKHSSLEVQTKKFDNYGPIKANHIFLAFEAGINHSSGVLGSLEALTLAGRPGKYNSLDRFSSFQNKGLVRSEGLIRLDGKKLSQNPQGRFLAGVGILGHLETYNEQGSIRSPGFIRMASSGSCSFSPSSLLEGGNIFVSAQENLFIKPEAQMRARDGILLTSSTSLLFEKGRQGGLEVFAHHRFPWDLFLDPECKKYRHRIKELHKRVTLLEKKFSYLQEQLVACPFGIHLYAKKALMQGDVHCGNGSFSLVAREANVFSTIKGGAFTHSSINLDISHLTSSGSLSATQVHYQSFFARIKDELKTEKLMLSGGSFVLGQSIPVALLVSSAQALIVESGVNVSCQDVAFQGGGLILSQGSYFDAKSTKGTMSQLLVAGTCDTGESNITFEIMNLAPTGTLKGRGDLKTEIAFLNGVFGFSGNLEARSLTVIQDIFTIMPHQKILSHKATLKPRVFTNQGTFYAEDVLAEINHWENTPQSNLQVGSLHGDVVDFEGHGFSSFSHISLQGSQFTLFPTSSTSVSRRASLHFQKGIHIAGNASIEQAMLESPKTYVGGAYHGNSMDLSGQESVLSGSVSLASFRSLCAQTSFTGHRIFKGLYIHGSNTTIGPHGVLEALTGTFFLSGSFSVQGKLSMGQINATLFQFLIGRDAVAFTPHGRVQSNYAHNHGTWTVDTLNFTLTHFYNYCRLQGSSALILKGDYLHNPGVIEASHIELDYDRYGSFGTLASATLGMRLDDRPITAQVLVALDGIASRGTLELRTHNPVCITSSGHLRKSLTLTAPSLVFQAHRQHLFSFWKRAVYGPGFESLTSGNTLRLVSTKEGIRISDFRIDAQVLLLHSSHTLDVLGSHLRGENYLETFSTHKTNIIKTHRPSLLQTSRSVLPWNLPDGSFLKTDSGSSDLTKLPGGQQISTLGIVSVSGEKFLNHASSITSPGSVVIQGTEGISATPEITTHHESHTKKSFFGWKKKTTHRTWQTAVEPSLLSADRLILFAPQGAVCLTGLQAIGTQNLYIRAQKDVEIRGTVTQASTQISKSFGFGLKRSSTTATSQAAHPSIMASLNKLQVLSSQEGILAHGVTFFAPTMEFFAKKNMVFTLPALTSSTATKRQTFFVDPHIRRCYDIATSATPRDAIRKLFPLINQLDSLRRAEDPLSALSRTTSSGITLVNMTHRFKGAPSTGSFLGQQAGLLNDSGALNTSVSFGWKTSHHKTTKVLPGEGGIWADDATFHSLEGDLLFDNAFGVNASKSLIFDIRKGTLHTRGFEASLIFGQKNQSYSLSLDALSPTVISGGDLSLSGRKSTAKQWIPQTIHSPDITFEVRNMTQENARIGAKHVSGKIGDFRSITHLDTLEHDAWGIAFGANRSGISHAECYSETHSSGTLGVLSGITCESGSLEVGTFTTQGGQFSFGDTKVSCDKLLISPVLIYNHGEHIGISYQQGPKIGALGFEYHSSEYEALSTPEFSGTYLKEAGIPFKPLQSSLSVTREEKANYEVTIPLFTLQKESTPNQSKKPLDPHPTVSFITPTNEYADTKIRNVKNTPLTARKPFQESQILTEQGDRFSLSAQGGYTLPTRVDNSLGLSPLYPDKRTHAEKLLDGDYSKILAAKRAGTWKDLPTLDKTLYIGHDLVIASYGVIENSWNDSFGMLFDSDKADPFSMPGDIVDFFSLRGKIISASALFAPKIQTAYYRATGCLRKINIKDEGPALGLNKHQIESFAQGEVFLMRPRNNVAAKRIWGGKSGPEGVYLGTFRPKNPQEGIKLYGLEEYNSLSNIRPVTVERGSTFLIGRVAPQRSIRTIEFEGQIFRVPTTGGARQILTLGDGKTHRLPGKDMPLFDFISKGTKKITPKTSHSIHKK